MWEREKKHRWGKCSHYAEHLTPVIFNRREAQHADSGAVTELEALTATERNKLLMRPRWPLCYLHILFPHYQL